MFLFGKLPDLLPYLTVYPVAAHQDIALVRGAILACGCDTIMGVRDADNVFASQDLVRVLDAVVENLQQCLPLAP